MTDQPYTPPPDPTSDRAGDQAQLDALDAYLPLLNNLVTLAQDHYDDTAM